ncbi:MAG: hypothetical protein STSR0004_18490 [Peptococcaceae bacterium]
MAVNKVPAGTVLRLKLQIGVDEQGNPKYRNKNMRYVKAEAVDQDLFDVAQSLAGLQEYTLAAVQREDAASLVQA